jgi:hypothetical protein
VSTPAQRKTDAHSSRQPRRDWSIVIAAAVVSAAAIFPFTAKPTSWDEWVYMGLAFHPQPAGWMLNRFAHVYAMKPFMWLAGDPFVGTRLYWCALFGIAVGALVWAALQLPARRGRVIALTLFLFMGQEAFFRFPGVAYADYATMAVITVCSCLVLGRIARGVDLSPFDAAALGLLFCIGCKAKETVAPALVLAAALFVSPSGQLYSRTTAKRLALCWLAGAAVAMCSIVALDGFFLHDALFSLRPSSWRSLLGYNTTAHFSESKYSWLGLMLQPESFTSFALYLGAGLAWASRQRIGGCFRLRPPRHVPAHDGRRRLVRRRAGPSSLYDCNPAAALAARRARDGARARCRAAPSLARSADRLAVGCRLAGSVGFRRAGRLRRVTVAGRRQRGRPAARWHAVRRRDRRHRGRPQRYPGGGARSE